MLAPFVCLCSRLNNFILIHDLSTGGTRSRTPKGCGRMTASLVQARQLSSYQEISR